MVATLHQVLHVDPKPPSSRRSRVPRDLETIALKCLRKEPAKRYASAFDLAADLGRFLRHEPIMARPLGALGRTARWTRRNPAAAALAVVLLSVAGVLATRLVVGQVQAAELRADATGWLRNIDQAYQLVNAGQIERAVALAGDISGEATAEVRGRTEALRADLRLAQRLDEIRTNRVTPVEGRFDLDANKARADEEYRLAFQQAGIGSLSEDPRLAAKRIVDSPIRPALVNALDDWAVCATDPQAMGWLLEVARATDTDPQGWRDRVRDPALTGTALEELAETAKVEDQPVQILVALGQRMRDAGVDALPLMRRVQQQYPGDFWANFALGEALMRGSPEEAVRFYQAAVAVRPENAIAHDTLGRALGTVWRTDEAMAHFRRAIDLDPGFSQAFSNLGRAFRTKGMLPEALELTRQAVHLDPSSDRGHRYLGEVLRWIGKSEDALEEFEQALALNPRSSPNHYSIALGLYHEGRIDEAIEHCEEAIRIDPTGPWPHYHLGSVLKWTGRIPEAASEFEAAIRLSPRQPEFYRFLGDCFREQGRLDEALYQYDQALARSPKEHETYVRSQRRGVLVALGLSELAVLDWKAELAANTTDHGIWYGYPELCLFLGKERDYQEACSALLERFEETTDPQACERVGRACLLGRLTADETRRAVALVERAVENGAQHWGYPYFLVASALAKYRLSDLDGAVEVLQGEPSKVLGPLPNLILSMAHFRAGRSEAAWTSLAKALGSFDWTKVDESDAWLYHIVRREAELLVLPNLEATLSGDHRVEQSGELLAVEAVCRSRHLTLALARTFQESFAANPRLAEDLGTDLRYSAACAAAQVCSGVGEDATNLSQAERSRWRKQALCWLRDDLGARVALLVEPSSDAPRKLAAWIDDPRLAGLREPNGSETLPGVEGEEIRELWRELEGVLASVGEQPSGGCE